MAKGLGSILEIDNNDNVVDLGEEADDEEAGGAPFVEMFVHVTSVYSCRVYHQEETAHDTCHKGDLRVVFGQVDAVLD